MRLWVEFRPYRRPFKQPLQTAHGRWQVRQGILLRLQDSSGRTGFGEIAPIPWFGSESVEAAIATCKALAGWQDVSQLQAIPPERPACQFGVGTALNDLDRQSSPIEVEPAAVCGLLPAGEAALDHWQPLWQQGHRTFKWKVGVQGLERELECLGALAQALPTGGKLRLDANGGLSEVEAHRWLSTCDGLPPNTLEFLEQPLPPTQFDALRRLSQTYRTPIALDESVATLAQLKDCHQRGWRGLFVIKPSLCGYSDAVIRTIRACNLDWVLSSALETGIGQRGALALLQGLSPVQVVQRDVAKGNPATLSVRALGFGTGHWFDDDWDTQPAEQLWQTV